MTPFDPWYLKIKFDTSTGFIISKIIFPVLDMTKAYMIHRKQIFRHTAKLWPQMTLKDQILWNSLTTVVWSFLNRLQKNNFSRSERSQDFLNPPIWLWKYYADTTRDNKIPMRKCQFRKPQILFLKSFKSHLTYFFCSIFSYRFRRAFQWSKRRNLAWK